VRFSSIRVSEQDPHSTERAAESDEPSAEVAHALATLLELAMTLDNLDLDGVEPVFVPRELT